MKNQKLECCVIKGQYPHKCDMLDCNNIVCDMCGARILHECANEEQIKWLQSVLRKLRIGEQFAEVCYDCAKKVVIEGIPVEMSRRTSRVFVDVQRGSLIDEKGNLG